MKTKENILCTCIIRKDTPAGLYFGDICRKTKALRNTTNFYIRNTYTGIAKSPEERTHHETEVLHYVFTGIQKCNVHFAYICSYILEGEVYKLIRMKKVQNHVKFSVIFAYAIVISCPV